MRASFLSRHCRGRYLADRRVRLMASALCAVVALAAWPAEAQRMRGDGYGSGGSYQGGHGHGRGHGGFGVGAPMIGFGARIEHDRPRVVEEEIVEVVDEERAHTRRRPRAKEPRKPPVKVVTSPKPEVSPPQVKRRPPRQNPKPATVADRQPPPPPKPAPAPRAKLKPPAPPIMATPLPKVRPKTGDAVKSPPPAPPSRPPVAPVPPSAPRAAFAEAPHVVPGEVLCEVAPTIADDEIRGIGQTHRIERISLERVELTGARIVRYRILGQRPVDDVVRDLVADPRVRSAQPNQIFSLSETWTKGLAASQYALAKMRLAEAHAVATGAEVNVAVIDSGVDPTHPALTGAVIESFDAVGAPFRPHAHGTAVAGLVAARGMLSSPAPAARLLAARAFSGEDRSSDKGGQGTTIHILRSLDWAYRRAAKVVNMSFAGPRDAKISEFVAAASARGMIFVAAAGNAGPDASPLYPAADPNVIAVTATDAEDRLLPVANRGPHLGLAAPGVDVLVASPGGGYGYLSGTSMASAGVAGVVALMAQARPSLGSAEARAALTRSAVDRGAPGPDPEFGAGVADARAALEALGGAPAVGETVAARP